MKLGIMQPYFLPYIGYFQLINAVDKYVIYDDVQFIKGGWINRNYILLNGEKFMFNLILKGASANKLIDEICINTNQSKLLHTIENAYKKAPFFEIVFSIVQECILFNKPNLGSFIGNSIQRICCYLNINTEIIYSSSLGNKRILKGKERVINICQESKAETYINAIGGQVLYDKAEFKSHGIDLKFLQTKIASYRQFDTEFIPCLSMLDVMMFNSIEEINAMLNNFELI